MKKLILLVCLLLVAAQTPPQLPSSFYGYITPNQREGTIVSAWVDGAKVASKPVQFYNGSTVYGGLDVPCIEGEAIVFKVGGRIGGYGVCHIGTNTWLDLSTGTKAKRK